MGDCYKTGNGFPFITPLCLILFITLTTGSPVQNQYLSMTEGKQFNPEFDQEDSGVEIRNVAKRFALRDTSGLFLNHFPMTNSLSTPVISEQVRNYQHHSSILNKSPSTSSAFGHTQRVIELSPTDTEWTGDYYQPPRLRKGDTTPNDLQNKIIPEKREYNDTKANNDRNTKIQEWKDASDKLMGSWSYIGIGTTTQATVAYVSRSPDWNSRTTPVLRESMHHGPSIVKTRVPANKRTMIGQDESTMSQKHFVQLTGRHVTESSISDTSKQSKTSTYLTKHSEIKTKPIVPLVTPVTTRHLDGGYVIEPHLFEQSVYHKPSQLHTRTLIPNSWKTVDHGRSNASITVSDTDNPDYMLLSKITEPRGYITETPHWADNYSTPESDRQIPTTNPTGGRPEYTNSQVDQVTSVFTDVKYDTSTDANSYIETTSKQEDRTSLVTGIPQQLFNGSSSLSTTSAYPLVENTINRTRVINSVSNTSEFPGMNMIQATSADEDRFENNALNNGTFTTLADGTPERTEYHNNSTESTGKEGISQTTSASIVLNTVTLISTTNQAFNQTHQPIENDSPLVSETTTAKTPGRKYITRKKLPTKMKVYDIKEIIEGKIENNLTNEKTRSQKFRKNTPMKVYDVTDRFTNNADWTSSLAKGASINSDTSQSNLSRKHSKIEKIISISNDKRGYMKDQLKNDEIKLGRVHNDKTHNTKTSLSTRPENANRNDKSSVDVLAVKGRPLLTILKNQAKRLKTSKNHGKYLPFTQKRRGRNSIGERPNLIKPNPRAIGNIPETDRNNVQWLPRQQHRQTGDNRTHTGEGTYHDPNVTIHTGNDTYYITRAIEVIKGLIDKIQAKPIVKAMPRPQRKKYLLIPLGNLTFTDIKKKLLDYQVYTKEFRNDQWSDNSLVSEVNTETGGGI